jgi:hypothetical protein
MKITLALLLLFIPNHLSAQANPAPGSGEQSDVQSATIAASAACNPEMRTPNCRAAQAKAIEARIRQTSPDAKLSVEGVDNDILVEKWQGAFDDQTTRSPEWQSEIAKAYCPFSFKRVVIVSPSNMAKYEFELNCSMTLPPQSQAQQPDASQSPPATRPLTKEEQKQLAKQNKAYYKDKAKWDKKEAKFEARVAQAYGAFPGIDKEHAELIANHRLFIGMTADMLRMSWDFNPEKINFSHTESGVHQQLVYDWTIIGKGTWYIYVDNGIVTSWQHEE